ncbi:TRAP dicarboxylate transporter, DctQ subunit, unknown substrate 4 [Oxalobacteraceae bacterium IMCC9480]|nr:TRAP dicarboxylate transporter, DctQ subunit, unknown substrate 4 [Oxalobacteraceae bacterium IMCC9480]NDP60259.1 TRAP transporter small permease [Oxalobacteraceae bacterium]
MNLFAKSIGNGLRHFNSWMALLSAFLIFAATLILVYAVLTRYFFFVSNDWVIELCVFLLIGATFLAAAYTQAERGHVGIEIMDEVMPPRWNRLRHLLGDVLSLVVVAFIANNAWEFTFNAYDQNWRTDSTWGPSLWIPYSLMAFGMTTLALQMILQIIEGMTKSAATRQHQPVTGA